MFIVLRDELTYVQVSMICLKHNWNDAENMTVQGEKNPIWFEGWCGGGWVQGDTDSRRLGFFFFSHLVLTIVLCLLNKLMEFLLSVRNAVAKHWVGIRRSGIWSGLYPCNLWFGHVTTCQDNIRGRLRTNTSPPLPCWERIWFLLSVGEK